MKLLRFSTIATALPLLICCADLGQVSADPLSVGQGQDEGAIFGGEAPTDPYHAAVVSLHNRFNNGQVGRSIFCTGTLIAPDVVMTAGHCLSGNSNPAGLAIYFGDDPTQDNNPRFIGVSETSIHPSYSPSPNFDLAYVRLSEPVFDVVPILPLPQTLGFTQSDVGQTQLEFVGFGRTEFGGGDTKLRAFGTLGGLGLNGNNTQTQIEYTQSQSGGPCNGDSGGPAFILRGGTRYLAGVTSYGDQNCTQFGVSARVDTQAAYVADALDGALPPDIDDNADPVVALVSPADGATLPESSVIQIVATASDDFGLSQVGLEWDFSDATFGCPTNEGAVSCSVSGDTYTWSINVGTGSRTFRVVARDFVGNEVTTPSRTVGLGEVTDLVAPTVSILSPSNGQTLQENGPITVSATASDDIALTSVVLDWEFSNESFACPSEQQAVSCVVSGSTYTWTINVGTGERPFTVTATDVGGNVAVTERRVIQLGAEPSEPEPDPTDPEPTDPEPTDPVDPTPTDPVEPNDPVEPVTPGDSFDAAGLLACGQSVTTTLPPAGEHWFQTDAPVGSTIEISVATDEGAPLFVAVGTPGALVLESNDERSEKVVSFDADPELAVRITSDREATYEVSLICPDVLQPQLRTDGGCAQTSSETNLGLIGFAFVMLLTGARRSRRRRAAA